MEMKNYIVISSEKGTLTELTAKELRRYLYVLGEEMPLIVNEMPECGHCIIAARRGSKLLEGYESVLDYKGLGEEGYLIFSPGRENEPVILTGDTEISLLYAAYHFLELQGIRFYLHGDTIPEKISSDGIWHAGRLAAFGDRWKLIAKRMMVRPLWQIIRKC